MSKKTTIVSVAIVILLILAIILIFKDKNNNRLTSMYEKMQKSNSYTFSMEEKTNEVYYKVSMAKRGKDISIDMYSNEDHTTTLITEKKTYSIMHNDQEYYDYGEEKIDLDIEISSLEKYIKKSCTNGKEEINGKTYYFEEYENEDIDFVIFADIDENSTVKTRFYFNGKNICYIKNIIQNDDENQEELIKADLTFSVDEKLFNIPEDYAEVTD